MKEENLKPLLENLEHQKKETLDSLLNDLEEKVIDRNTFKAALIDMLLGNTEESKRYFLVLIHEVSSYSYRAGYKAGASGNEYDFRSVNSQYIDEISSQIDEILENLV